MSVTIPKKVTIGGVQEFVHDERDDFGAFLSDDSDRSERTKRNDKVAQDLSYAILERNLYISKYPETPMDEIHRIAREASESVLQSRVDKEESDLVKHLKQRLVEQ